MSDVYFVQTHYVYDSYKDFFRLAELSGYPVISLDAIDIESDNTYIVTPLSGEWERRWDAPVKANVILWDMEWRLKESDYEWPESALVVPPFVKRVWASDKWYAERINAEYVPLGSHAGLAGDAPADGQGWDIAALSYRTGRRNHAFGMMERNGLTIAPNAWGDERDSLLKEAKTVVHVHQHERVPTVAPLRFAIAAAWHKALISEQVHDRGLFDTCVLYAEYGDLADYTALMVRRYASLLKAKADEVHDTLCVSNSFRSFVEAAL
jgi:hypothetical protein